MKPCTKVLYVSLIRRCDSAAMVSNTSELLPEPETPVKTVSRRLGISMLTSLRLFSRAPYTRIRSWLSASCRAVDFVLVFLAMLIVLHLVGEPGLKRRRRAFALELARRVPASPRPSRRVGPAKSGCPWAVPSPRP